MPDSAPVPETAKRSWAADVVHSACPHDCPSVCALEVERLDAREALLELLRCPRSVGWRDPAPIRAHLAHASELVRSVPVFRATVPVGPPFPADLVGALVQRLRPAAETA